MKKALSIIMLLALALTFVSACSDDSGTSTGTTDTNVPSTNTDTQDTSSSDTAPADSPDDGGDDRYIKVSIGITMDVHSFEPWAGFAGSRMQVIPNLYEQLFVREVVGGPLVPVIGKSYEQIDDVTYIIEMHDNVYDIAGNHITASDVVFSFEYGPENGIVPGYPGHESVRALDDYTIELKLLRNSLGIFSNAVTMTYIVSEELYMQDPDAYNDTPITTGPYKLANHVTGASITLVKNENWWQKDLPNYPQNNFALQNADEIEYKIYGELTQLAIALETGEIDLAVGLADSDHYLFEGTPGFSKYQRPDGLTTVFVLNASDNSPCKDQKLRQAILYAIDNEAIVMGAYDGKGGVAKTYGNHNYSDFVQAWNNQDYYGYDPAKAAELLAESSYNGETLTLMTMNIAARERAAQIIQATLGEIGINVEIISLDAVLFDETRLDATAFDMFISGNGHPSYLAGVYSFSWDENMMSDGLTFARITDPKLQELVEACLDPATHGDASMDAFHQYLKEMAYGAGICYIYQTVFYDEGIVQPVFNHILVPIPGAFVYSDDFSS